MNYRKKNLLTKNDIKDGFLEMLKSLPLDKITVLAFITLLNSSLTYTVPKALTLKIVSGSYILGDNPALLITFVTSPKEQANSTNCLTLSLFDVSQMK